jgi:glycosyltransferase involved in cell wall biosynthesis
MRVLIVAHEFSPYLGSECAVGWNLVSELSKYHKITVIIAESNQFKTNYYYKDYLKYISLNEGALSLDVISIPQTKLSNYIIKFNRFLSGQKSSIGIPFLYFLAYNLWQRSVYNFTLKNINLEDIDIVHQLTSISFREPGYFWKINKPFFWGPISGNVKIPSGFYSILTIRERIFQNIRNILLDFQLNFSVRINSAINRANTIYCVTKEDLDHFRFIKKSGVYPLLDVGSFENIRSKKSLYDNNVFNFIWVGRIVPSKALEIFLYSISNIQKHNFSCRIKYTIIGDGPDLVKNKKLADDLGLCNIFWEGHIAHELVKDKLLSATCMVHTSIREATSASILEALSFGVPVICHDAFGMAIAVTEDCGIKVPFSSSDISITGFTKAMVDLVNNEELLYQLSLNATKRSHELSWKNMAKKISNDYQNL